MYKKT